MPNPPPSPTMKAAVLTRFSEDIKSVVEVKQVPIPVPTGSQVLIKVHASSINPIDWKFCTGMLKLVLPAPPIKLGFDISGVVEAVGPKCTRLKKDDGVWAMAFFKNTGAYAEYAIVEENLVGLKPSNLTHQQAASLPLVGMTSYQCLINCGHVKSGDKVLILGASGGTGTFAVQFAKYVGAYVYATCSEKNFELVKSLGADECIDYRTQDWEQLLKDKGLSCIYDCVGGWQSWDKAKRVLNPATGSYVTIAGDAQTTLNVPKLISVGFSMFARKMSHNFGSAPDYTYLTTEPKLEDLDVIKNAVEAGAIKPVIQEEFPLDDIVKALEQSREGRTAGKLVISIA